MATLSVCVFAASSEAVAPTYRRLARDLGTAIAARGWRLVYGGGQVGLMGEVARAVLAAGGHVIGVIPHRLNRREVAFDAVTELITVDTMAQRKTVMDERADGYAVLPGGLGTLDELLEVLTTKQLGFHTKPLALLDPDGYWAPLHALVDHMVAAGLAAPAVRALYATATSPDAALDALALPAG